MAEQQSENDKSLKSGNPAGKAGNKTSGAAPGRKPGGVAAGKKAATGGKAGGASRPAARARPATTNMGKIVSNGLGLMALAVAIAIAAYLGHQLDTAHRVGQEHAVTLAEWEQRFAGLHTGQSDLSTRIDRLQARSTEWENSAASVAAIRNDVDALDDAFKQVKNAAGEQTGQVTRLTQDVGRLAASVTALEEDTAGDGSRRWIVAEIEQLIVVADQRLRFAGEVRLAITALRTAEARLAAFDDPTLNDLGAALAADIDALQGVEVVDVTDVLTRLAGLSKGIGDLPLAGAVPRAADAPQQPAATEADEVEAEETEEAEAGVVDSIAEAGATLWQQLGNLIQVEKNAEEVSPVVSAELRQWGYMRGQLLLDSAQLAFMRGDGELYANRLGAVRDAVSEYFATDSAAVRNWLARLDAVAAVPPRPDLPSVQGSLEAVHKVRATLANSQ